MRKTSRIPWPVTRCLTTGCRPAGEIVVIGDGEADVKTAAAFEHDGERAECIIYDPKRKYRGPEPDHKIESLIEAAAILEKE